MVRGLYSDWRNPIYYEFDDPMKKEVLLSTLAELKKANFDVVAVTSDLGPTNQGFWNDEMHVSHEKPWFVNPATGEKVFFFADAPHLIKLVRNHLIDQGFKLNKLEPRDEVENVVSKYPIEELLNIFPSDLPLHRLTRTHLSAVGMERQKVKLAVQLLSNSTSLAIKKGVDNGVITCKEAMVK